MLERGAAALLMPPDSGGSLGLAGRAAGNRSLSGSSGWGSGGSDARGSDRSGFVMARFKETECSSFRFTASPLESVEPPVAIQDTGEIGVHSGIFANSPEKSGSLRARRAASPGNHAPGSGRYFSKRLQPLSGECSPCSRYAVPERPHPIVHAFPSLTGSDANCSGHARCVGSAHGSSICDGVTRVAGLGVRAAVDRNVLPDRAEVRDSMLRRTGCSKPSGRRAARPAWRAAEVVERARAPEVRRE
jgi:hypothetical protein